MQKLKSKGGKNYPLEFFFALDSAVVNCLIEDQLNCSNTHLCVFVMYWCLTCGHISLKAPNVKFEFDVATLVPNIETEVMRP